MIALEIYTDAWIASMKDVAKNQIPYAMSRTLNAVTKAGQLAVQNHTGEIFHLRQEKWIKDSIKITKFSSKYAQDLYTIIGVHPPGGDDKADILTKFETETEKTPFKGSHVVVPIGINEGKILREGQRFSDYHFVKQGNRWEGDRNTFIVPLGADRMIVLQRVEHRVRYQRNGKRVSINPHDAMPLFVLVPSVKITPDLQMQMIITSVVEQLTPTLAPIELDAAIANAA